MDQTNKAPHESQSHHPSHPAEWHKRDPLGGVVLGAIIILAGVLLFLDHQYYLEDGWFWWLLAGIGVIFLIEAIIRYTVTEYHRPVGGKLIAAGVLLALGGSHIYFLEEWWPLLLIITGILIVYFGIRPKSPKT